MRQEIGKDRNNGKIPLTAKIRVWTKPALTRKQKVVSSNRIGEARKKTTKKKEQEEQRKRQDNASKIKQLVPVSDTKEGRLLNLLPQGKFEGVTIEN